MSAILYIMGKSATGKDTVYRQIKEDYPELTPIVPYTTRPMREGETEGVEYHFVDDAQMEAYEKDGKVIEKRTYQTVFGPWTYATVDDGSIETGEAGAEESEPESAAGRATDRYYVAIGTLEAYTKMRRYFGEETLIPIYLYTDDATRLERAIGRENQQARPNYREVCRRFLADEEDFSDEKLLEAGIIPPGDPMSGAAETSGPQSGGGESAGHTGFEIPSMEECYPKIRKMIDSILAGD